MSQKSTHVESIPQITHEYVLVVKRETFFSKYPAWQGMRTENMDYFAQLVTDHQEFVLRAPAETDETYKQIIPYLIFMHNNKLFVMQRKKEASEQRLASKLSLGIGGHVRQDDMDSNNIIDWAKREFQEEVNYQGDLKITKIGIINDDSNAVGRVHIGFVYLVQGDNEHISIKDEHKSGELYTFEECEQLLPRMENWSQDAFKIVKNLTT